MAFLVGLAGCGRLGFGTTAQTGSGAGDGASGDGFPNSDGSAACMPRSITASDSTGGEGPTVAWNGTELGVTWIADPEGTMMGEFRTATLAGIQGAITNLLPLPEGETTVDIVPDGSSFRLALGSVNGTYRQVYRSLNGATPAAVTTSTTDDFRPRIAMISPGVTAYAFEQMPATTYEALLAIVDADGTKVVNDATIASNLGGPYVLDLDFDGTDLAAFYWDGSMETGSGEMYLQRVSTSGATIGTPVAIAATTAVVDSVATVWVGDRHLVAWSENGTIKAGYLDATAALLHPVIELGGGTLDFYVAAAAGSTADLVLWGDTDSNASYLMPMQRDGTAGTMQMIADTTDPVATWIGNGWAVATETPATLDIVVRIICE